MDNFREALGLSLPTYAYSTGKAPQWVMALVSLALLIFSFIPIDPLQKEEVIALEAVGMWFMAQHLLIDHFYFLNSLNGLFNFLAKMACLLLIVGTSFLSVRLYFRKLFGSLVTAYILSYTLLLGLAIQTTALFFILAILIGLSLYIFTLSDRDDFHIACLVKGSMVPFLLALFINSLFRAVFRDMHNEETSRLLSLPPRLCMLLGPIIFIPVFLFYDRVRERVEEAAGELRQKIEQKV